MSLKPKRKNSNNIIDRDIDKMDSVSPSLSTSWKPKTRFSSPGSHGGDNINKNKKSIIPPGSLIDEESLNALTNNLSRHTDAKVSGNSVSRNAVAGNGNNTHRKMPSSPSLFFKKKSKFNNNNKLLPAANISKSTSMPKIEVPEISQSPFPRINKPTFEIQDLPDPFRTPVRHIRNVPSSEPRIKFPTSSISRLSSPPRVQPFAYNQSPRQRKNLLGIRCVFCDEPLESVLTSTDISEKIIELKCGDTCHEQCFNVAIEFSTVETPKNIVIEEETFDDLGKISNGLKNTNGRSIFPICKKCNQEAIPSDDNTADSILTKQLLENSKISLPTSISKKDQNKRITTTPKLRLSPSIISSTTPSSSSRKGKIRPNSDLSIDIPDKRLVASGIASLHHRKASRGSSISAMSSIISSASKSPISSPTSTKTKVFSSIHTQKSFNNSIPLALLRSRFIADLTRNFEKQKVKREISESIVDSFGLLRLADKLLVSKDGKNWSNKYCYLFSFQLLIVNSDYNDYYTIKLANNVDHNASSPASSPAGIKANFCINSNL
ncbi:hypothetical protein PACTADRAFT_1274 [Pachysolen tannophilus NRRL Y-2460]|uniref:Uncharacterized protein n=1 Tax=Pachysolen tannophilus NRRL Y-2460 TaxID=669874 RepID=A0A1E4TY58_PACTA|nr:hypothetical protein PACTADRAFT_1274 [Pachysolen tannophilus NRRL Y-2460]